MEKNNWRGKVFEQNNKSYIKIRHFNSFIVLYKVKYWETKTKACYYVPREGRSLQFLAFLLYILYVIGVTFD